MILADTFLRMCRARKTRRLAAGTLAIASVVLPPAALGAGTVTKQHGPLAPPLVTLAKPWVASKSPAQQARILGFASSGPGSLLRRGDRLVVRLRFDHGALARSGALRVAGARVLDASRRYQSATVSVSPGNLKAIAAVPAVVSATPERAPMLFGCEGGDVISEGVAQLKADQVQAAGVKGAGEIVGVLSDSYDQATGAATDASEDVESADLPGLVSPCTGQKAPVNVLEDFESESSTDEGRGMLQIAHDMAPEAALSFATAFEGEEGFAKNIETLATAGAKVIVDDVGYFEEPMFQDGPIANAISKVTSTKGVTYLSAAGNDNLFDNEGNEFASWEAPAYRDSGGCPPALAAIAELNAVHCMDFNPGPETDRTYGIKVEPGETLNISLQWAEPWEGVVSDIDAFLLDDSGQVLPTETGFDNLQTQRSAEVIQWENPGASTRTVQLVINKFSGPGARLKLIFLQNGGGVSGVEYPRSGGGDVVGPSIYGHAGATSAIAVAAVPFNDSGEVEFYSSRGPVTHYFEPFKGPVAADPIPGGEEISKPDVAATDCGRTTFFAFLSGGVWHFCGTSAAAPHAAGAVALMRDAAPLASTALLRQSLLGTASSVPGFGPCAAGGGLVETVNAVKAAKGEITPGTPGVCEPPDAGGAVFVAPGDWGSETPPVEPPPQPNPSPTPAPTPPAPNTSFAKHPVRTVRIRGRGVRLVFRFRSDQAGVAFLCKVDGSAFRACGAKLGHSFKPGRHVVRVKARNAAGLTDPTPAVFRFKVERIS
jgi:hypothetical protein